MFATTQEMVLPEAMANNHYDANASPLGDASQSLSSFTLPLPEEDPQRRASVTLEEATKGLIHASHILSTAAHEYTIAVRKGAETNDEEIEAQQLIQGDLDDYSSELQGLCHYVTNISAYMQRKHGILQTIEDATMELQFLSTDKTYEDAPMGSPAAEAKEGEDGYLEATSDTSDVVLGDEAHESDDNGGDSDSSWGNNSATSARLPRYH